MRGYAFLGRDGTDFLSTLRWPAPAGAEPGEWLEPGGEGVRAARVGDLVWWLDDELWEVELGGAVRDSPRCVHAARGRLLQRIAAWTPQVARELVVECARRVREVAQDEADESRVTGLASDVVHYAREAGDPVRGAGVAAYIAAVALAGEPGAPGYEERFDAERRAQAAWLASRLGLTDV